MTPHNKIIQERLETAITRLHVARGCNERGDPAEVELHILKAEECIQRTIKQLSIRNEVKELALSN